MTATDGIRVYLWRWGIKIQSYPYRRLPYPVDFVIGAPEEPRGGEDA